MLYFCANCLTPFPSHCKDSRKTVQQCSKGEMTSYMCKKYYPDKVY